MKILLTGKDGQLGQALINTQPKSINDSQIDLIATSRYQLDISNHSKCRELVETIKPDWLINSAAYTNVDKAEEEPELVKAINSEPIKYFAEALLINKGKLIQISTDYVFDGLSNIPYKTSDNRNPINVYGRSKADAEDAVKTILFPSNQGKIIRTSWLMSAVGKNFAKSMLHLLNNRNELGVVSDQIGGPTNSVNLAKACWKLIKITEEGTKTPNIFHYTDSGCASWYDIATSINEIAISTGLLKDKTEIIPISTSDYPTKAKRPNYSILETLSSKKILQLEHIHWRSALEDIILEISNNQN